MYRNKSKEQVSLALNLKGNIVMNKSLAGLIIWVFTGTAYSQSVLKVDRGTKTGTQPRVGSQIEAPKSSIKLPQTLNGKPLELQPAIPKGNFKSFGGVNGGGGDEIALDFHQAFYRSLTKASNMPKEFYDKLMLEKLDDLVNEVSIFITDDEIPVVAQNLIQNSVAYNEPSTKQVLINRNRWTAIQNTEVKEAIALHEILSLKQLERTGYYPYSAKYLSLSGGNPENLDLNLNVDRLKQIMAQKEKLNKPQIIERLYKTATVASLTDIPLLSQSLNYWGGCVSYMPALPNEKPFSLLLARYYGQVVDSININAEDGPLFKLDPSQNQPKLIVEALARSFVEGKDFKSQPDDIYTNLEVLKDSKVYTNTTIHPEGEIPYALISYVNTPRYLSKVSIRKDNQYLYFEVSGKDKRDIGILGDSNYGYCWKK